jgi:ABC-type sugar transport system ATPase subunit
LSNLDTLRKNGLINRKKENVLIDKMVKNIDIKLHSVEQSVSNLSGGNQQKVVLAKWMSRDVKVIILDEPTRGIDVGAKYEIYTMIGEMASRGIAVVVISSEIPELLGICNRIYVMCQGMITGEFQKDNVTQEDIMKCSVIGYKEVTEKE